MVEGVREWGGLSDAEGMLAMEGEWRLKQAVGAGLKAEATTGAKALGQV